MLCAGCGFLYRHPGVRPERLGDLYGTGTYGKFLTGHYAGRRQRRYRLVMDAFAPLFDAGDARRLLDFGSGSGLFLEVAHRRGFDGYGVDLAPDAVDYARTQPGGANSFCGSPGDVPEIAAGGFDVVTLWSVLAHLPRPAEDLTMLRGLLTDDGALLILTVNANSLELKAERAQWGGFTANHLKFFSPSTLCLLLQKAGFGAVVIHPMLADEVAVGKARLTARQVGRMRGIVGNRYEGNMLRAVAYRRPRRSRALGAGGRRAPASRSGRAARRGEDAPGRVAVDLPVAVGRLHARERARLVHAAGGPVAARAAAASAPSGSPRSRRS